MPEPEETLDELKASLGVDSSVVTEAHRASKDVPVGFFKKARKEGFVSGVDGRGAESIQVVKKFKPGELQEGAIDYFEENLGLND
jgi:hypothetical protein